MQANRFAFARTWPAAVARLARLSASRRRPSEICPAPALRQPPTAPDDRASWLDERSFCLYVPINSDSTDGKLSAWSERLRALGLTSVVTTIGEPFGDSVGVLNAGRDAGAGPAVAEPYLEVFVGGETGALLYYRGDEIERELLALHDMLGLRVPPRQTES